MHNAYVLINCDIGHEVPIIEELKQLDNVKDVHGTFGGYDIVTKIEADSADKIRRTISEQIRQIKHIRTTLTLMGIGPPTPEKEGNDLIPDIIPDEKKPKEPPAEPEYDEDDEDC